MGWVKCRGLGASHSGAEPPGRPFPRAQELGASDRDAELGASHSGSEPRVHFRNSFRQRSICEKLSKKGSNGKKSGVQGCMHGSTGEGRPFSSILKSVMKSFAEETRLGNSTRKGEGLLHPFLCPVLLFLPLLGDAAAALHCIALAPLGVAADRFGQTSFGSAFE